MIALRRCAYFVLNGFWLLVPILLLNICFMRDLPAAYQTNVFWKDIPNVIGVPENVLRTLVMMVPLLMPLRIRSREQRLGLLLYVAGLVIYAASWWLLIVFPGSAWSTSAVGFMGPAWTPILWLGGIGFLGETLFVTTIPYRRWMYWLLSAAFLLFHNLHAALVYARLH